jgi:hypothetical protein
LSEEITRPTGADIIGASPPSSTAGAANDGAVLVGITEGEPTAAPHEGQNM